MAQGEQQIIYDFVSFSSYNRSFSQTYLVWLNELSRPNKLLVKEILFTKFGTGPLKRE